VGDAWELGHGCYLHPRLSCAHASPLSRKMSTIRYVRPLSGGGQ
jgi:hypothetical protein